MFVQCAYCIFMFSEYYVVCFIVHRLLILTVFLLYLNIDLFLFKAKIRNEGNLNEIDSMTFFKQ